MQTHASKAQHMTTTDAQPRRGSPEHLARSKARQVLDLERRLA